MNKQIVSIKNRIFAFIGLNILYSFVLITAFGLMFYNSVNLLTIEIISYIISVSVSTFFLLSKQTVKKNKFIMLKVGLFIVNIIFVSFLIRTNILGVLIVILSTLTIINFLLSDE